MAGRLGMAGFMWGIMISSKNILTIVFAGLVGLFFMLWYEGDRIKKMNFSFKRVRRKK